ncbi:MAG: HupE/UreJ family protein [Deltaproteobacteria bacterium]|nr:HupE/UreJ family protein [Deltaproteobacteria bacterium]
MRLPLLVATVATLLPAVALAHPIDEVVSQALIDLQSRDAATFQATVFLDRRHIEGYAQVLERMGLPAEDNLDTLTMTISHAFRFGDCAVQQRPPGQRSTQKVGGGWVGFHFTLKCPGPQGELTLHREQYSRDKTRTTLLWTVNVAGREPVEALVQPHLQSMTLALDGSGLVRGERGKRLSPYKDSGSGVSPADPTTGAQMLAERGSARQLPPVDILTLWAEEGAVHLATGVDHLLFLLTLVIGARGWSGLLAGVTAFSLGHMTSMAVSLWFDWPPVPLLDLAIGGTIALSAWQGRRVRGLPAARMALTSVAFGLIHGLGFGTGLKHLTVGVSNLWWPLLSFGLGLDLAQTLWVALGALLWKVAPRQSNPEAWQLAAARVLMVGGALAGVYALIGEMLS